jgi:hypothetical protein
MPKRVPGTTDKSMWLILQNVTKPLEGSHPERPAIAIAATTMVGSGMQRKLRIGVSICESSHVLVDGIGVS